MPRSGVIGTYSLPPNTNNQAPNTPISSSMFNAFASDVQQTFNDPTPIAYGGTGAATAAGAATALEVVSYAAQTLTGPQQAQALTNIGAVSSGSAILNDANQNAQSFSDAKKVNILKNTLQAWEQIGGRITLSSAVATIDWTDLSAFRALRVTGVAAVDTNDIKAFLRMGSSTPVSTSSYRNQWGYIAGSTVGGSKTTATGFVITATIGASAAYMRASFETVVDEFNNANPKLGRSTGGAVDSADNDLPYYARHSISIGACDVLQLCAPGGMLAAGTSVILEGIRG